MVLGWEAPGQGAPGQPALGGTIWGGQILDNGQCLRRTHTMLPEVERRHGRPTQVRYQLVHLQVMEEVVVELQRVHMCKVGRWEPLERRGKVGTHEGLQPDERKHTHGCCEKEHTRTVAQVVADTHRFCLCRNVLSCLSCDTFT